VKKRDGKKKQFRDKRSKFKTSIEEIIFLDEFRINHLDPHRHFVYVFAQVDGDFVFLKLTHSKKSQYIELLRNPNPQEHDQSYLSLKPKRQKRNTLGKPKEHLRLSNTDKERARPYMIIPQSRN